jgi:hypothetical protein
MEEHNLKFVRLVEGTSSIGLIPSPIVLVLVVVLVLGFVYAGSPSVSRKRMDEQTG